jgi:hypothetical protein
VPKSRETSQPQTQFSRWFRDGNPTPLQAIVNRGGSKDHQTTSTLTITPTKDDDGARYRCVVFNRAMKDGEKYEAVVTLAVNCKYSNKPTFLLLSRLSMSEQL